MITNQKQLVELRMTYEDEASITEYSYDSNGKLVSATKQQNDTMVVHTPVLIQSLGSKTKSLKAEMERQSHIHLENGLITHTSDSDGGDLDNTDFTYNANNPSSVKLQYDEEDSSCLTWQGEKLTKMVWSFSDEDIHVNCLV